MTQSKHGNVHHRCQNDLSGRAETGRDAGSGLPDFWIPEQEAEITSFYEVTVVVNSLIVYFAESFMDISDRWRRS